MDTFELRTHRRTEFADVTGQIRQLVRKSGLREGTCLVYCPHTTAALTINENADPDVVHDVLAWLNKTIPHQQPEFRHAEGNSDAHLKAILVGSSVSLIIDNADLVLGRWQGVFFCEFDGPRTRSVKVRCSG